MKLIILDTTQLKLVMIGVKKLHVQIKKMIVTEENYTENFYSEIICNTIKDFNNSITNCKGTLIIHLNIQSLTKNFNEFKIFLHSLTIKPKLIIMSETWQIPCINLFNIDNYDLIYNERDITIADGSLIYIDNTINYDHRIININSIKPIEISFNNHVVTAS